MKPTTSLNGSALLKVFQLFGRKGELEPAGLIPFRFGGDRDDLLGMWESEGAQRGIEHPVQCRIRTETDRERQHGRGRERLVGPEKADRVAKIGHGGILFPLRCRLTDAGRLMDRDMFSKRED
jgi:hypothetical protein